MIKKIENKMDSEESLRFGDYEVIDDTLKNIQPLSMMYSPLKKRNEYKLISKIEEENLVDSTVRYIKTLQIQKDIVNNIYSGLETPIQNENNSPVKNQYSLFEKKSEVDVSEVKNLVFLIEKLNRLNTL